jgi:predicted neutral ceramidase superfamily lipid hydrolase
VSSSDLIRWSGLAAILAGVAFLVDTWFSFTMQEVAWTNVAFLVALPLMLVALLGLHALQKTHGGRIGRVGFLIVVVASLAQVLSFIVFLLGSEALILWLSVLGYYVAVPVGLMLYGVATLQARVLPRWCGLGLIIIPPVTVVLGNSGWILFALLWLALGYVLWSWKGTAAGQPSRVS